MRPKPMQLTVTTSEQVEALGPGMRALMLKNVGNNDCWIDFDKAIDESQSYLLEAGETMTMDFGFIRMYYKGVGATKIHLVKVIQ